MTQRYVHIDEALRMAADRIAGEIAGLLGERGMKSGKGAEAGYGSARQLGIPTPEDRPDLCGHGDVFAWDCELRGFGIRLKPSGAKIFLIQYRNADGRMRRLVLGQYGALTPEIARELARRKCTTAASAITPPRMQSDKPR